MSSKALLLSMVPLLAAMLCGVLTKASDPLEAVVLEQSAQIDELKALVESLKNRMDTEIPALQKAVALEQKTVAFHADFYNYTANNYNISDGGIIAFDNIILNEGDGYDNDTGYFTAPESGLYSFSVRYEMVASNYLFVSLMTKDGYQAFGVVGDPVWQSGGGLSSPAETRPGGSGVGGAILWHRQLAPWGASLLFLRLSGARRELRCLPMKNNRMWGSMVGLCCGYGDMN